MVRFLMKVVDYITSPCVTKNPSEKKAKRKQRDGAGGRSEWVGRQGRLEPTVTEKLPTAATARAPQTIEPRGSLGEVTVFVFFIDRFYFLRFAFLFSLSFCTVFFARLVVFYLFRLFLLIQDVIARTPAALIRLCSFIKRGIRLICALNTALLQLAIFFLQL